MSNLLSLAIKLKNAKVAEFLFGKTFYKSSTAYLELLTFAIKQDNVLIWKYTSLYAAQINEAGLNTPLHILCRSYSDTALEHLEFLLRNTPRSILNLKNSKALTPLALEIQCKNTRGARMLIDAGANANIVLENQQTALHIACRLGNQEAADLLMSHGSDLFHKDSDGLMPKVIALRCGYPDIAATIQNAIDSSMEICSTPTSALGGHESDTEDLRGELPFRTRHQSKKRKLC